ncbi:GNAT family N-acetyltransferase [Halopiger goleimassiliensis]|uniref:GNAT family N-acetyltransferase n=1 Tax=Halopiger goleimassiliensis TaxID=1293048 RepID=UPI000677D1A2|nr:GNAT family N-acetyltransferase [Halopiger goleimassiliensis]
MEIRPAEADDFAAIEEIARRTWHATYDELDAGTIDRTVDEWYAPDSMPLDAPGTVVLVVEVDGNVVGFTHAVAQGDSADVLRLYVHPDHQGEGIGTALHERLIRELEAHGVETVRSLDFAFNDASRQFYTGLGFERTDTGEVVIEGERYDEAVYTLEL